MGTELATAPKPGASKLSGLQKAATLLVSVGEEHAGELFKHLGEERDRAALARDRQVAQGRRTRPAARSISEAVADRASPSATSPRAASTTPAACSSARSARSARPRSSAASRPPSSAGRSSSCAAPPPEQIHVFLRNESPQTVALVVANLHTTLAAEVLSLLDADQQADVARRVATMHETRPEVVAEVEAVIAHQALQRHRAGLRGRRRRRSRWPRSSTRPTARPSATCSTSSPRSTPSWPRRSGCCCSPSRTSPSSTTARSRRCSRRSTRRTSRSRCAGSRTRSARRSSATCPSAAPSCCARRSPSSRRSGAGSSRRPRAASSASCARSRTAARSSSRAARRRGPARLMAAEFSFAELAPAPASSFARPSAPSAPSAHSVLEAAAHAEAEAEAARAAAREEGYADGLAAGRAEALAALGPAAAAAARRRSPARGTRPPRTPSASRPQAVDLALYIAEKVVAGAVAVEPERVLDVVRGALRSLVERERVTVLVHPDDLELVREAIGEIRASARRHRALRRAGRAPRRPRRRRGAHARGRYRRPPRDQARACARGGRGRAGRRMMVGTAIDRAADALRDADLQRRHGRVRDLIGLIVEATGLEAEVGEVCTIDTGRGRAPVPAEVVGFRAGRTLLMAARRRGRHRPGRDGESPPGARCASASPTPCSAAPSTASAARSTASAPSRSRPASARATSTARRPTRSSARRIDERVDARRPRARLARALRRAASASASSPAPASASPRCWG